ncbi:MAG: T9SS type A sorting domain-containing protein [Bacteroidia bacterium]|nr:T9SS type A sorting domain-containing protein [Bacteroidia bacterium]
MRFLKVFVLVGLVGISRVGLGQGREEMSLPGYQHPDMVKSMKLYPNPGTDFISLKLETPNASQIKLTLHNIIGNELELESEIIDDNEVRFKVKDLASGYYLLAVKNEISGFKGVYKFLKL